MPWVDPKSDPGSYSREPRRSSTDLKKHKYKFTDFFRCFLRCCFLRDGSKNYFVIGGLFVTLLLAMGLTLVILLSSKTVDNGKDDVFQSCSCSMDIALDFTYSLTSDEFEWEKEYVTYYLPMFNPYLDDDESTVIYYCDSNDHCAKWPTRNVKQTTGKYLKSQKLLKQKQVRGVLDNLGGILLTMVGSLWSLCQGAGETEISKCMNYTPYNNLVFMGNPSINPPPEPYNLDVSGYTYNGSTIFDYVHHFAHGLTGENRLVVVLLKNESYDKWNQTNLQQWLDAGIKVVPYNANQTALTYEIRNQLLCDKDSVEVYIWPGDDHNSTSLTKSTYKSSKKTTFETTTPTLPTRKNANRG